MDDSRGYTTVYNIVIMIISGVISIHLQSTDLEERPLSKICQEFRDNETAVYFDSADNFNLLMYHVRRFVRQSK